MSSRHSVKLDIRLAALLMSLFLVQNEIRAVNCEIPASSSDVKSDTATPIYNSYIPAVSSSLSSDNSQTLANSWRNFEGTKNHLSLSPGDIMKKVMSKGCSHRYTLTCLKLDVVSLVDRLSETDKYQLLPGVTVVRDNSSADTGNGDEETTSDRKFPAELVASLARDYPNDVDSRLDAFLIRKIGQYLNSHSITVKLFDEESFARARQLELEAAEQLDQTNSDVTHTGRRGGGGGGIGGGGGGGKGGKKGMGQLLMAALMMKGTLLPIAFAALAGLAGKALMTGLLSLMLSAIIGLKSLTSHGGKQAVTYEIVQKPVYSHAHSHSHELHHEHLGGGHSGGGGGGGGGGGYGHSSYGRSFNLESGVTFRDETSEDINHSNIQSDADRKIETDSQQMAYSAYVTQGSEVGHGSLPQASTLTQKS